MKYCPLCDFRTDNKDYNFCPNCSNKDGRGPVKLVDETTRDENGSEGPKIEGPKIGYDDDIIRSMPLDSYPETKNEPEINTGMGTVIGGDVIIHKPVYQQPLSETELIIERKNNFRQECLNKCHNGFISEENLKALEFFRESIGLGKHDADDIIEKVKKLTIKKIVELPDAAKLVIEEARFLIEQNNSVAITTLLSKLKAWKDKVDNDTLNQNYYQLKAIIEPAKYIDEIDSIADYWGVYWSYVAYLKVMPDKAEEAMAALPNWDTFYPIQNQTLLSTIGYLMNSQEEQAKKAFIKVTTGYTSDLQPIYDTINSLIGREWKSLADDIPATLRFYSDSLFKTIYETLRQRAKVSEAQRLEEEARKKQEEEKNKMLQESFTDALKKNNGDEEKACEIAGIDIALLSLWKQQFPVFNNKIQQILQHINDEKDRERRNCFIDALKSNNGDETVACEIAGIDLALLSLWKQQYPEFNDKVAHVLQAIKDYEEEQRLIAKKKKEFLGAYETNDCDLGKTCRELELSPEAIKEWRTNDAVFNNAIINIEEEYKKWIDEQNAIRRKKLFKKLLPYVLCGLLVVAGILGILYHQNKERKKAQAEQEIAARRDLAIIDYNESIDHLKDFISSIPDDVKKVSIEKDVTTLDSCYTILYKVFNLEKNPILADIKHESVDLKERLINKTYGIFEYAKDLGSAPPNIPDYKQLQQKGQKYLTTIDSLKQLITALK